MNFTALPATLSAFETLNEVNINYESHITINGDLFHLRSVVFVDKSIMNKDLITGCSAGIILRRDYTIGRAQPLYLCYDPLGAGFKFEDQNRAFVSNPPIYEVPATTPYNDGNAPESFQKRASKRGTIFIYVRDCPQTTSLRPY